jgi:oligosaccharide repeat unit polymerase
VGLLASLAFSFLIDCKGKLVRLIRVDLFMLLALYGLTFFEFLFEQPPNKYLTVASAQTALLAAFAGFAGIAVGRHLVPIRRGLPNPRDLGFSPKLIFQLLLLCTSLGYFYMLLSVGFNPIEMVEQMLRPRFTQPWTRGRLGGPSALLAELSLLKAAIPALCGLILAQRDRFRNGELVAALLIGGFVLFDGYSSGTRNVFLLYSTTFVAAYFLYAKRMGTLKLLLLGGGCAITAFGAMVTMLETRTSTGATFIDLSTGEAVFVDMNLINIASLTEVFSSRQPYLGLEIPYTMIIRPIPRALWPGKPEGLTVGIEEALGVGDYMTLSATFIGEFWMAGGLLAVCLGSLFLGGVAGAWNRFGARADTQLKMLIYITGLLPAGLCMRSFLSVAPTLLPIFALLLFVRFTARRRRAAASRKWPEIERQ